MVSAALRDARFITAHSPHAEDGPQLRQENSAACFGSAARRGKAAAYALLQEMCSMQFFAASISPCAAGDMA